MKRLIVSLLILSNSIFASLPWELDSTYATYIMDTDYFYMTLLPENYPVVVGVIGSGVEPGVIDDFLYVNSNEIANNGVDDDGNGIIDDVSGARFYFDGNYNLLKSGLNMADESIHEEGHETQVASIIASQQLLADKPMVFGVSYKPDKIKILPIQFYTEDNVLYDSRQAEATNYAVSMNVDLITASYGDYDQQQIVPDAYERMLNHGIEIVASAGNNSKTFAYYPCAYDRAICVGGVI